MDFQYIVLILQDWMYILNKAIKGRVSDRWTIPETSKFKKGINSTGLYAVNVQEELWIF